MLLAVWRLLTRTHWGTLLRAATQDREMAAALGVNQAVLFTSVFAFGAFLAGLGGALSSPREPANLAIDLGVIADVFVVTVIGGLGSIPGAYVAAVLISVVKAWCIGLGDLKLGGHILSFSKLTLVAEFIVMAVVLIWRPWGLFGSQPSAARVSAQAIVPLPPPDRRFMLWVMLAGLLLVVLPLIVNVYTLVLLTDALIFALFAASLGLMMGAGGMASFGHAAYFGVGAYAAALAAKAGVPILLCFALGMGTAALTALLFGWFCVRLSGVSLAMLTMAFAQITWAIAFQWDAVTGGSNGLVGVWPPSWLATKTNYYLLTVLITGGGMVAIGSLIHAPFGYALRALRDSDIRATSIGIDRFKRQWQAFVLAGAFAGLAGSLFVFSKGSLSPDTLSIPRSMDALVMVLLGGVQTLMGPVIGALVFTGLQDWTTRVVPYWQAVLGSTVILLTVAFPAGIVGTLKSRFFGQNGWRQ
jgi:branched-chain amino acid transport system permease protein